jgi:hypothetical protein
MGYGCAKGIKAVREKERWSFRVSGLDNSCGDDGSGSPAWITAEAMIVFPAPTAATPKSRSVLVTAL